MALLKQVARLVLFLQAVNNIIMGCWTISNPFGFAKTFKFNTTDQKVIQSIGLGALGMGVYGAAGAYANLRSFYRVTAVLRLAFAGIMVWQWGAEGNVGPLVYECLVAAAASIAASLYHVGPLPIRNDGHSKT